MTLAVRQVASGDNRDDTTAAFSSACLAGSVIVACLFSSGDSDPQMFDGTWTLLGSQTATAHQYNATDYYYVRIYAKDAAGGETSISREATSSDIEIVVLELTGVAIADVTTAKVDHGTGGDPVTVNLGTLSDAIGIAVMATVHGRGNDQHAYATTQTPGSGWTEQYDHGTDVTAVTNGWAHVQTRVIPATPISLACTADVDVTTSSQTMEDYAGVVALFTIDVPIINGVFMDWDGDGFDPYTDDDVTTYVMSWTISRGSGPEITASANPGSCTIILKNTSDRFNPYNESGPLYGLLTDGVPVWIGVTDDGKVSGSTSNGMFGGRITDITVIPSPGSTDPSTVEIVCADAFDWYPRLLPNPDSSSDYAEGRAQGELREIVIGRAESTTDLAHEITTMPVSHFEGDVMTALTALNAANGTRHFIKPADLYTDWYTYTSRNRQWRLDATIDASLDASSDHVTGTDGWRMTADTVTNQQSATVTPISFTAATFTVWEADPLPIAVDEDHPYTVTLTFDDYVADAVLDLAYSGDTVTSTLTPFGTGAYVALTVAPGDSASVTALSIEGRLARRLPPETYIAYNFDSQNVNYRGARSGPDISGEDVGVLASARGIAEHIVWRYGDPQLRPSLTVENWMPEQFQLDLYDTIALTSTHLSMDARIFEIVGLTHVGNVAASSVQHHVTTYQLQECKVQSDPGWFYLDSSELDGTDILAY